MGKMGMHVDSDKIRSMMAQRSFTQTELARLSGVSRATIVKLLNPDAGSVHRSTVARVADALGVEVMALDRDGIESAYRSGVVERNSLLRFSGLGLVSSGAALPLEKGFAAPSLRSWRDDESCRGSHSLANRSGSAPSLRDHAHHSRQPVSVGSALTRSRRLFLLGDPGSGKTTVLRHLALSYAQRKQRDCEYPDEPLIPIFVRLADWAAQLQDDGTTDAVDAAVARLKLKEPADTASWLHDRAKQGTVLFLLDGLDEVANPDDQGVLINRIRELVKSCPDAHVVITSRTVGFDAPRLSRRFNTHEIQHLDVERIREFASVWCAHRHGHPSGKKCVDCEERFERLDDAINDHPRIQILAGNPMMLTILCLLHDAGAALPQQRWQLFDKICEAFLFSWQENKRTALSGAPGKTLQLDDREILWLLESLALEMQRKDWTLVARWWLADAVGRFLRDELGYPADAARIQTDAVIWSLERRSGVLRERGPDRFGFWHLALQEHFAARAISEDSDPIEAIRPYLYHPRWREVVRLVAARLDRRSAPKLLRLVLDDPDPTGRFLHRGLLLALDCLADGAPVHDPTLLNQMAGETEALGTSKWLGITIEAFHSLRELQSTRLENFADDAYGKLRGTAEGSLTLDELRNLEIVARAIGLSRERLPMEPTDQPDDDTASPIGMHTITINGKAIEVIFVVQPDGIDRSWITKVLQLLHESDSGKLRIACARASSTHVGRLPSVSKALLRALDNEEEPSVRVAIVEALEDAVSRRSVCQKLLYCIDHEEEDRVRGASAAALGSEASGVPKIRDRLVSILRSDASPVFREGAARGLADCIEGDAEIRELLCERMADVAEDDDVRGACLRALEDELPSMRQALKSVYGFLSESSQATLPRIAAQILAGCASTGQVEWSSLPIEQIERVLVSIEEPCPHYLEALRGLVDAREFRKLGIPREKRIAGALASVRDHVDRAFIFGSAARGDQGPDSDIDLMVIGDVSLRDLTPGLRKAEQELGRQINAVVYSPQEWEERKRKKNPFVMEVSRGKTVSVLGECRESSTMA